MKKHLLVFAFLAFGSATFSTVHAQTNTQGNPIENAVKKDGKYAILVRNVSHLKASIMTGEELKRQHPKLQFEIVLIGEVVKDLAVDESLKPFIENSAKLGIKLVACEFAMEHFAIKKTDYLTSVETTPNGFKYIFGLQEMGFKTITL